MNRWSALAFLLALAVALALRLPGLDRRPLHNDEGVNATKLAALLERGEYRYDPHEFHGPTLHYFGALVVQLCGTRNSGALTDTRLRLTPVAFGVGLILLLLLLRDALGDVATAGAALLIAVSPALVFYSRYLIHEMLLVFFTLLAIAAGWRYWQSRKVGWAVLAGVGLGLMWATKETFVFALGAMVIAAVGCQIIERWRFGQTRVWVPAWPQLALGAFAASLTGAMLFTSFLTNPRGVLDSVLTYQAWLHRAGGASPHIHAWHFYFERLLWFHPARGPVWTEAVIALLALLGSSNAFGGNRGLLPQPGFVRFLSLYTVVLAGIYALVPYKTPWCLLGFWSSALLLAGVGVAALWRASPRWPMRLLAAAVLLMVFTHLGWQAWRAGDSFAADRRNPYVYAQTLPDVLRLVDRMKALARIHPDGAAMPVKIILPSSEWPLPWYLRQLKRVGWWTKPPEDLSATVVIADAGLGLALDEKSNGRWLMAGMFEFRPGVFLELYVEAVLWKQLVASPRTSGESAP